MAKIKQALEDFRPDSRLIDERGPTGERIRKSASEFFTDDNGANHTRENPADIALAKGQISKRQHTAAHKLYVHWFRGGLQANYGSVDMHGIFGGKGYEAAGMAKTEAQAFHRQRFRKAIESLISAGQNTDKYRWPLVHFCCYENGLEQIGRAMGWNNRPQALAVAIERVRAGLDILCDDWGIFD